MIQRALRGNRVPHAYVFHGPDGVGKEAFATAFAQLLLCPQPRSAEADLRKRSELADWTGPALDVCDECDDCRAVRADTHPDLHRIYRQLNAFHPDTAVRNRKALDLGVDVVRHFVIEAVGAKPGRGRAKVFIVREADRITTAAQNALLKTLEEPPATTFLILLVSSLERLLPTTFSRCQLVSFSPLPDDFVAQRLRELRPELEDDAVAYVAQIAEGSLGLALRYVDDGIPAMRERIVTPLERLDATGSSAVVKDWMESAKALGAACRRRDPDVSDTEAQRQGLHVLLSLASAWYRARLRSAVNESEGAPRAAVCADAISAVNTAARQVELNANVQLCLEALVFRLARQRAC
jgi:DNA polymerase-3 subunit delta'